MKNIGFLITLFLISCTKDKPDNLKQELYSDGKVKSEVPLVNGKENGLMISYYENGNIKSQINKKENLKDGYSYFFYPNGVLKSIGHYKNGNSDGSFTWYNKKGDMDYLSKFENNQSKSFMEFDIYGNIINASPFIVINSEKDTITLGEKYTAKIRVNFPIPDFDCKIYVKTDSTKANGNIFTKISDATDAIFIVSPKEIGEYTCEISMLQIKYSENKKDSVVGNFKKNSLKRYWVVQ